MARRRSPGRPGDDPADGPPDLFEVDLHGLAPEAALRRLEHALHAARVQRARELRVITGRGLGNREQRPILRERVEAWLRGADGRRFGVADVQVERSTGGGSVLVRLRVQAPPQR